MSTQVHRIKAPWHLWFIGLFFLFLYSMGAYDYFMMLGHNAAYYESKNYGEEVYTYFTNYPLLPLIFWTINIFSSLVASVLLLLRRHWVVYVSLVSAISIAILEFLTFAFRDRWNILGPWIAIFDISIMLMTFGFFFYCRNLAKQGKFF
ncbi:MAG: hypothetical protein HY863_04555 [Chloroflexi bacterium]|nr:hypothetical protein [Chloroflexota bacterium]